MIENLIEFKELLEATNLTVNGKMSRGIVPQVEYTQQDHSSLRALQKPRSIKLPLLRGAGTSSLHLLQRLNAGICSSVKRKLRNGENQ